MGTYGDKWKAAKLLFTKTAKVKKPSAQVDSLLRKPAGIDKVLAKLDALEKKIGTDATALKSFQAAALEFKTAKDSYIKVLDATVGKEPKGTDQEAYKKGVAVLRTQLVSLEASLKTAGSMAQSSQAGRQGMAIMADNLMDLIESSCKSALAFVAKVEADPTPENFNANVQKAARDITQNIGNVDKLKAKGFVFAKSQPTNLFTILKAWGNDRREVPKNATKQEVLREVNAFKQAVEGVQKWAE